MTKAIAQTYTVVEMYSRQINTALIFICVFTLFLYAMNVYHVISRTVALESIQGQTADLTASVDKLDGQYLEMASKISPDALQTYGFKQGQVSAFISRTTPLGSVATRGHEL